jgi:hypothetical protein
MIKHKPGPIPVVSIIRDAIVIPWRKRATMFRALLGISAILIALEMILPPVGERQQMSPVSSLVFAVLLGLAFTVFAVTCHRLVLLGGESVPKYGLTKWSSRETRFVGWALLGYFCILSVWVLLSIPVLGLLLMFHLSSNPWVLVVVYLVMIPCGYVFARLSVLLPATAVDERPNVKWAREVTEGNGWRLVLIVGVLPVVLWAGPSYLLGHSLFVDVLIHVAACLLYVVQIAALSLSYQHLAGRYGDIPESLVQSRENFNARDLTLS